MVISKDVTAGVDQKATSKYVQLNGPGAAFSGDNGISPVIGERIAIRVNTGKPELRATLLLVKTQNRVDQTNAV